MAEALGHAGYDYLIVDLQHGENNLGNVQGMLQAVSATPAIPMVRVPANMPVYLQRTLDLGAYGIVVPLVDTRADAEAVVASVRYAPTGGRSWGPVRGAIYGGADYFAQSPDELLVIVMLETAAGLRNARDILSVPGIDGCFIGPNDLSISQGFAPEMAQLFPIASPSKRRSPTSRRGARTPASSRQCRKPAPNPRQADRAGLLRQHPERRAWQLLRELRTVRQPSGTT
jgi:4-hydroxy-2-oxoheptanedioate aldolase